MSLATKRLEFIDALRGLAIVLMMINHAGHYLTPGPLPDWAYLLIYLTVTLAAPLFLFLVGFSLVLSIKKAKEKGPQPGAGLFMKYFWRGLMLIGLGLLVNLFFYYDEPLWRERVLMTIGLSVILAYPFYGWLTDRFQRLILLVVSLYGLMLFPWIYPICQLISQHHQMIADLFFSEFPIYPWFLLVLLGMICGQEFMAWGELTRKIRKIILSCGLLLLLSWLIASWKLSGADILSFANDYNLNGYWNPSPLTWLWILGWILILFLFFYGLENSELRNKLRNNCLVRIGRAALSMYFLQFFLIITIGQKLLGLQIDDLITFSLITLLIIFILCLSAKSSLFATATIYGRLKPRARIS